MEGDTTLFVRRDEVEAQWGWIDSINGGWAKAGITPQPYDAGSWGPDTNFGDKEQNGDWHD